MVVVLDACALIALLRREQGHSIVAEKVVASDIALIHAVNWCEVRYDFLRREGGERLAEEALADIRELGIEIYELMDEPLWRLVSELKARSFSQKTRIALADCFALTLAKLTEGQLLTADHEMAPFTNFCSVHFFRNPGTFL